MGDLTKIEWADHTFNPWLGCMKVSEACANCYAENWAGRWRSEDRLWGPGPGARRVRTSESNWRKPLMWDRQAAAEGGRRRVFCASLADWAEDYNQGEAFTHSMTTWRTDLWRLIRLTPNLDWLLLTKRADRIAVCLPDDWGEGYPNVWLGTTVENQKRAEERIPHLLQVPAVVRFLSCEPLLGPVNLRALRCADLFDAEGADRYNALRGASWWLNGDHGASGPRLHWVIAGGESGPKARPMNPNWVRDLRWQCEDAGTPFLFKQWGAWSPDEKRLGKKATGRELDGRTHDGLPEVRS